MAKIPFLFRFFMPASPYYSYNINKDLRLIDERYTGQIGVEFINESLQRMVSDPEFDSSFDIIVDFSGASFDESCMDPAMLEQSVECHDRAFREVSFRTAVIVEAPFNTACVMLFKMSATRRHIRIFSTRQAAEAWIDSYSLSL
jgi:uncharacterized DUF497 family protein